ncbi:hypothetical protein [Acinetobacter baumannii]|uniref:hypothetical protein n=1 Tax=Acinetobacter baumannii TaxID=470 RepID=UPI0016615D65|nr:hypothetical protein [Acinetobacter baumannii]MBD0448597.1 hypothetical protein [Acinetobacter baumannii]
MQYNFTHELSELLHFTAGVGTAARLFSAYSSEFAHPQARPIDKVYHLKKQSFLSRIFNKPQYVPQPTSDKKVFDRVVMSMESSQDLMWITDTIHNFNSLAEAINSGNPEHINKTCDRFITYFKELMDHDRHTQKGSKGNPAETFSKERFRGLIEIERAINAINSIKSKLLITE